MPGTADRQRATLAGGCFWCLEAAFEELRGVEQVTSGYTGGHLLNPTYAAVCEGETGHAEAVQVTFDPGEISYRDLLGVFFTIHDPTTLNRQGPDVGSQYRSAIFFHDEAQEEAAREVLADLTARKVFDRSIVTEIVPLDVFYPAEPAHARYFRRNPYQPYCMAVVAPKVAKVRKQYFDRLKK